MTYTPTPQKSALYPATGNAVSGFSTTVPDGITLFIINSAAALLTGTITLPANPTDGIPLSIICPKGITALTLAANTGQTIVAGYAPASLGALLPTRLKYAGINLTWYPN